VLLGLVVLLMVVVLLGLVLLLMLGVEVVLYLIRWVFLGYGARPMHGGICHAGLMGSQGLLVPAGGGGVDVYVRLSMKQWQL
jgi:hypothetical protein